MEIEESECAQGNQYNADSENSSGAEHLIYRMGAEG